MEKFIYTRVESILDPLLPQEQARFRRGRSTVDQVTFLTQEIEDSFSAKRGQALYLSTLQRPAVLFGVAASPANSYSSCQTGTWCHSSWSLSEIAVSPWPLAGNGPRSKLRCLRIGVSQGSVLVLAPLLFGIYTHDLPTAASRKHVRMVWRSCALHRGGRIWRAL